MTGLWLGGRLTFQLRFRRYGSSYTHVAYLLDNEVNNFKRRLNKRNSHYIVSLRPNYEVETQLT